MSAPLLTAFLELAAMIALGLALRRYEYLSAGGVRELASLAVNITCPLLVIASVDSIRGADYQTVLLLIGCGTIIYLALIPLARFCARLLRPTASARAVYEFMLIFSNTSLLGFPVVQSLYGDSAVFYTAIMHIPFDVLVYSYGLYLMSGGAGFRLRSLWNPGFVLTIVALVLYLAQLHLPALVTRVCYTVGNITTPISMLVIGGSLAEVTLASIFTERRLYAIALLRLIAIPCVIYAALSLLTDLPGELIAIATITFGMPVASMVVMLAQECRREVPLAVRAVSLTTLGCLVTVPLLLQLLNLAP